jgi:hypothetical protein
MTLHRAASCISSMISVSLGVLLTTACGGSRQAPEPEAETGAVFERGAIILSAEALGEGPRSLLAAMSGKVPNFRVRRPYASTCPEITLRGHSSIQTVANPHVYVDGTRTSDTCILDTLRSDDVERVEVYPQGFTTRPGYGPHGPGLILVFMRSAG